jgi:hypothetical protein
VLRVWAVSRRGGVSIFAEPADDVLVGEALTSLSWLAANVGGSLPLTTPTAARTFAGTIGEIFISFHNMIEYFTNIML